MQRINYILILSLFILAGCQKKEYALPTPKDTLQNDAIKRSIGPNVVGLNIEFAYAMAILPEKGKLVSAHVEASIPGANGTYLEHRSFYTGNGGADVGVIVANPSTTNKNVTSVTFNKDTSAATLRYYYVIPDEARGQQVSFTFHCESSNGETREYKLGPYTISKMDVKRNITVSDGNLAYISIEDMAVYNAATAATMPNKIDLVYLYRTYSTSAFNHALVSPAADAQYLPGITLPNGVNRSTLESKVFNLPDYHLAQGTKDIQQVAVYIDDVDFEQLNLTNSPNYAINLKAESGVWVQTADNKYRAYIFFNSIDNTGKKAVISIKRYAL
jgi:hypothetical protein